MFAQIFNTIFFQPTLNLLVWLYTVIPGQDIGVAIILLTIIIKLILYPLTHVQIKQQRAMQALLPMKKISLADLERAASGAREAEPAQRS